MLFSLLYNVEVFHYVFLLKYIIFYFCLFGSYPVDVILCDFHFDDEIFWWPIASSSLWFIDALFYLKSDISSLRDRNEQNNNSSNSAIEVQMQRLETIFV